VEPDSSVLGVPPRILACVALALAVGTWYAGAPRLGPLDVWPAVVLISTVVLPGTLLIVFVALPLARLHVGMLALFALALGLVAFGYSEAGWALAANFAKLGAAVFAGWAFLRLFEDLWLVVLVAAIIPVVDAISVFTPGAPTNNIVKHHISIYNDVAVAFVGPHGAAEQFGPPDIIFYALFLAAASRFRLRVGWTWLATTGLYAASFPITIAVHANGLPALPFLSVGFLAANGDLLWTRLRRRA
jgi:hypothetical protein